MTCSSCPALVLLAVNERWKNIINRRGLKLHYAKMVT